MLTRDTRPVAFDVTHAVTRLTVDVPSGIDKVDLAYLRHFAHDRCCVAVHYGLPHPRFHPPASLGAILQAATAHRWAGTPAQDDAAFARVEAWLSAPASAPPVINPSAPRPARAPDHLIKRFTQTGWRLWRGSLPLPQDAIYLNVAQHVFEEPRFFSWLDTRPDLKTVFMVHDLLPLDLPEYFRPGYRERFGRRVATILRHGRALITTSQAVAERITQAYDDQQYDRIPIHVEPLPSSLPDPASIPPARNARPAAPYFVVLGTIEPRKNHLLLLNIWRQLASEQSAPPRLVIVGGRGWENEQTLDVLERGRLTAPHVIEVTGLADAGLVRLLSGARALLMPSFAEGYGMPLAEALTLGVPVVASDIPVFREVTQGHAIFRHPIDGLGWKSAIEALTLPDSDLSISARAEAAHYRAPTWEGYFNGIEKFLARL